MAPLIREILMSLLLISVTHSSQADLTEEAFNLYTHLIALEKDAIKLDQLQESIDGVAFKTNDLDFEARITELANSISTSFQEPFDALRRLQTLIQDLYTNNTVYDPAQVLQKCCELNERDLEYNREYGSKIGDFPCTRRSDTSPENATVLTSQKIVDAMRSNAEEVDKIKWQYTGTEEGMVLVYPAKKDTERCGYFDPRFRPWYAEVATTIPKDVVIVMDKSESMYNNGLLDPAKKAAKNVVETLNPKDRVGLVLFSDDVKVPEGGGENCYQTQLAYATPYVQEFLENYIDDIEADGSTRYIQALEKAFEYFGDSDNRSSVILFLTDGRPAFESNQLVLDTVGRLNDETNNKVLILTYGLSYRDNDGLLSEMASMTSHGSSQGQFKYIDPNEDMRYQLAEYYSYFASNEPLDQPIVTVPYIDFSNLGLILSICLPIVVTDESTQNKELKGAACSDMTVKSITREFDFLQKSSNAYVFLIDSDGRTMLHPMLPIPGQSFRTNPLYADIQYFEKKAYAAGIIDSMKRLERGRKTILAEVITNKGSAQMQGVLTETRNATYSWRRINGTQFSVCLVWTDCDREVNVETMETASTFKYHKFEECESGTVCNNKRNRCTKDHGTVQFNPQAFEDASFNRETCEYIESLERFMTDSQAPSVRLKDGIRELYYVVDKIIPEWNKTMGGTTELDYNELVYERFVASKSGMFVVFPGTQLPDSYDHTITDWYNAAYSYKGDLIFTPPRSNEFGRCSVITVAHTILEGKRTHDEENDFTIGVVGVNIDAALMEAYMKKHVPICDEPDKRCMLIDYHGFLIYHPNSDFKYVHLAEKEPAIANDLIRSDKVNIKICDDFAWKEQYHTWEILIDSNFVGSFYRVIRMSNTNLFMVSILDLGGVVPSECKSCPAVEYVFGQDIQECESIGPRNCQCPCFSHLEFQPCENKFSLENHNVPTCTKPMVPFDNPACESSDVSELEPCFPVVCETFTELFTCNIRPDCQWCSRSGCHSKGRCPVDESEQSSADSGSNVGGIVGGVFAAIVLVLLILAGAYLFMKYRKKEDPKFMPDNTRDYNPNDNPIYDELHYTAPVPRSTSSEKPGSTVSTDSTNLSQPVGFVNTAYRSSSIQETALPPPPTVQYNTVMTSQYLTSGEFSSLNTNLSNKSSEDKNHLVPNGVNDAINNSGSPNGNSLNTHSPNMIIPEDAKPTTSYTQQDTNAFGSMSIPAVNKAMMNSSIPDELAPTPPASPSNVRHVHMIRDDYIDTSPNGAPKPPKVMPQFSQIPEQSIEPNPIPHNYPSVIPDSYLSMKGQMPMNGQTGGQRESDESLRLQMFPPDARPIDVYNDRMDHYPHHGDTHGDHFSHVNDERLENQTHPNNDRIERYPYDYQQRPSHNYKANTIGPTGHGIQPYIPQEAMNEFSPKGPVENVSFPSDSDPLRNPWQTAQPQVAFNPMMLHASNSREGIENGVSFRHNSNSAVSMDSAASRPVIVRSESLPHENSDGTSSRGSMFSSYI